MKANRRQSHVVTEIYDDFYSCRYRITHDTRTGICLLSGWTDRGSLFVDRKYSSYRGAKIALGKYTGGTAHRKERA